MQALFKPSIHTFEDKEREQQRVIRGLVCDAPQQFHELMDLIVAQKSFSRFEPWPDLSQT